MEGKAVAADLVSVVIATHNRRAALLRTVDWALSQPSVAQVVVVADRCTDGTEASLGRHPDSRVLVVRSPAPGLPCARNMGIQFSTAEWVLFVDDDDHYPSDYLAQLLDVADLARADMVAAPFLGIVSSATVTARADELRRRCGGPAIDQTSRFPCETWVETPWMCSLHLARRSVLDEVGFDTGYGGNYWREETDHYVSAIRRGYRVVLTNRTYAWSEGTLAGGVSRSSPVRYEFWACWNHARFLKKHGRWLHEQQLLQRPSASLACFVGRRAWLRVSGTTRRRWSDLVGRRS